MTQNHVVEPTFMQLLMKNGYVHDENSAQQAQTRKNRPWHVSTQKQKLEELESNSDDDYN